MCLNRNGNASVEKERETSLHAGIEETGTWTKISETSSGGRVSISPKYGGQTILAIMPLGDFIVTSERIRAEWLM